MSRLVLLLLAFAVTGCSSSNTESARGSGGAGGSAGASGTTSSAAAGTSPGGTSGETGGASHGGSDGGATAALDPACGPVLQKPRCLSGGFCWDGPSLLGGDLLDIDGSADATSVWAVGAHGSAFHYCKGRWVPVETGVEANLYGVYSPAPDFALAVGQAGTVIKWDGMSWRTLPPPTKNALHSVWGTSPRNVWIGADVLLSTDTPNLFRFDGTSIAGVGHTGDSIRAIGGRSAVDVYAGGFAGVDSTVLHFDGKDWTRGSFAAGNDSGEIRKILVGPKKRTFAMFVGTTSTEVLVDDTAPWNTLYDDFRTQSTALFLDDSGVPSIVSRTMDPLMPGIVRKTDTQDRWTDSTEKVTVFPADIWTGAAKDFGIAEGGSIVQRGADGVWTQVPERDAMLGTPVYVGGASETNAYFVSEHDVYHRDATGWHAVQPRSVNPIGWATTSPDGTLYIGSRDPTSFVVTFASYDGSAWTDLRKPSDLGTQLFALGPKNLWLASSGTAAFFDGVKWFDVAYGANCMYAGTSSTFRLSPDGKVWVAGRDMLAVFDDPTTCTTYQRKYASNDSPIVDVGWANGKTWAISQRGDLYSVSGTMLTPVAPEAADAGAGQRPPIVKSLASIGDRLVYLEYPGDFYTLAPEEQTSRIVTVDVSTSPPTFTHEDVPVAGPWWPLDANHTFIATRGGVLRRAR